MKFTYEIIKTKKPKNKYEVVIETMTGDADRYHKLSFAFRDPFFEKNKNENDKATLRNLIVACEILKKQYPHGQGGCDTYDGLPYWDVFFEEHDDWHYSEYCDSLDSFDSYEIFYYDGNGHKHKAFVELDEGMMEEINSAEVYGS